MNHPTSISLMPILYFFWTAYPWLWIHILQFLPYPLYAVNWFSKGPNPLHRASKLIIWCIYSTFRFLARYVKMGSLWDSWVIQLFWHVLELCSFVFISTKLEKKLLNILLWKWWLAGESCGYWLAGNVSAADLSLDSERSGTGYSGWDTAGYFIRIILNHSK